MRWVDAQDRLRNTGRYFGALVECECGKVMVLPNRWPDGRPRMPHGTCQCGRAYRMVYHRLQALRESRP